MKIHNCTQGTREWHALRLGRPTASMFDKIVTPAKGQLSKSSVTYAYKLVVERLLNKSADDGPTSEWMDRGTELEAVAADQYSFVNDVELERVGFITTDDGLIGASPDRLIKGKSAGLEIKVPAPWTHLGYLLDGPGDNYRVQVQGQLYVCEFEFVDFFSYSERMPACTIRTARDEPYIALLASALKAFTEQVDEMEERARRLGLFQAYTEAETDLEFAAADALRNQFRYDALGSVVA